MDKKKVLAIFAVPVLSSLLYFGLKLGYVDPMIKGIDIQMIGGTFITNLNKYVIKVGDTIKISTGDYVVIPRFSKKPDLKFINLDKNGVTTLNGNILKAEKKGYSTIGLINKNRVLKKVTIMVVDPTINNMEISLSNPIRFFGDKAHITSTVNVDDYKKLEKGYKLSYSTTNDKILRVSTDDVEAIGIGKAKLISRYGRKEIRTDIEVLPRVDDIEIGDYYRVEEGDEISLAPNIKTSPSYGVIKPKYNIEEKVGYSKNTLREYTDSGYQTIDGISIDSNGRLKANRVGKYLASIEAGRMDRSFVVDVGKKKFENLTVENLQYHVSKSKDKLDIEIGFDYNSRIKKYRVYLKSENDENYSLYTTINAYDRNSSIGGRLNTVVSIENPEEKYSYSIYVVGVGDSVLTKNSREIKISSSDSNNYQKQKPTLLSYKRTDKDTTLTFKWNKISKDDYSYRLYYKDRYYKESKPVLVAKNIIKNTCTIKPDKLSIDYDYFVMAVNKRGQISSLSDPVRVKDKFKQVVVDK